MGQSKVKTETKPVDDARRLEPVGRYQLLSRKGDGGQADVFLARDVDLGRLVAIKFLLSPDPDSEERIRKEAFILGSLHHPGICSIFDIGSEPKRGIYLVLELLEGETLRQVLNEGTVGLDRALTIIHDLAEALHAAHVKDVVHRDVKPENVVVLPDGSLKLFDFGIAKTGPSKRTAGVRIGTAGYMSPEQHRADHVDTKSDVFSLGCMFYELLTGRLPFETGSELYAGRYEPPPAALTDRMGAAADLLARMLYVDRSARPTMEEVAHVIAAARRAIRQLEHLDRGAFTEVAARMLESFPDHDAEPLPLGELAEQCGIDDDGVALAVAQMPLTFGALQCSLDESSGALLVRAKSEVAKFFLRSLAIYVRYGLGLIEDWGRRDKSAGDTLSLLGPDFVMAMERRRVLQYGLLEPIRAENPSQAIIKAFSTSRNAAVYLMKYDRYAQQYQLIGGKRRHGEDSRATMERIIRTKLPANKLAIDVDYQLQPVRDTVITRGLSRTVGAFTEYHFSIFSITFRNPLTLDVDDRWVTEEEMFSGELAGSEGPWNYHLARVANLFARGLGELPYSFAQPVE